MRHGGAAMAVADLVVEPALTVPMGARRELNRTIGKECDAAASCTADRRDRQGVSVLIHIVGQELRCRQRQGGVLVCDVAVLGTDRGIVDRGDGYIDRGGRAQPICVLDRVAESTGAKEARDRRNQDSAITAQFGVDLAAGRDGDNAQCVAVDVAIIV